MRNIHKLNTLPSSGLGTTYMEGDICILRNGNTYILSLLNSWTQISDDRLEKLSNKVSVVNAGNSSSETLYPSLRAMMTEVDKKADRVHSLGSHGNVDATADSATAGQILRYLDGKWKNVTPDFLVESDLSTYAKQDWVTAGFEPKFSKNSAFNKNFGTTAGTVAQGNDSRILQGAQAYLWGNHADAGYSKQTLTAGDNIEISTGNVISAIIPSIDVFSRNANGLVPMPGGSTSVRFLREDGTWVTPTNTTYTTGTLAVLNTGTSTTNSVWSAKTLTDWLVGKGYVTTDTRYSAGNGMTLTGTTFSVPVVVQGTGTFVQTVVQSPTGILVTLGTPAGVNYTAGSGILINGATISANFGTTAGTVAQGNDSRILHGEMAYNWGDFRNFGLGLRTRVQNDANHVAFFENGWGSLDASGSNKPMGVSTELVGLLTISYSNNGVYQIGTGGSLNTMYFRDYDTQNQKPGGWTEFWHKGNLTKLSDLQNDLPTNYQTLSLANAPGGISISNGNSVNLYSLRTTDWQDSNSRLNSSGLTTYRTLSGNSGYPNNNTVGGGIRYERLSTTTNQSGFYIHKVTGAQDVLHYRTFDASDIEGEWKIFADRSWVDNSYVKKSGDKMTGSLLVRDILSIWAPSTSNNRESILEFKRGTTDVDYGSTAWADMRILFNNDFYVKRKLSGNESTLFSVSSTGNMGIGLGDILATEALEVYGVIKLHPIGGTNLMARDSGGLYLNSLTDASRAEMILRHRWEAKNLTFSIGGSGTGTAGQMNQWGMIRYNNDRTSNGIDGFIGWYGNGDNIRISALSGTGTRMVVAAANGNILTQSIPTFDDSLYVKKAGDTMSGILNFSTATAMISNSDIVFLSKGAQGTILANQVLGSSSTTGIALRPLGYTIAANQVLISGDGFIRTSNHGTSADWKQSFDWGNHKDGGYWNIVSNTGYASFPDNDIDKALNGNNGLGTVTYGGANVPAPQADIVTKSQFGAGDALQISFPFRTYENFYLRTKVGNLWRNWIEVWTSKSMEHYMNFGLGNDTGVGITDMDLISKTGMYRFNQVSEGGTNIPYQHGSVLQINRSANGVEAVQLAIPVQSQLVDRHLSYRGKTSSSWKGWVKVWDEKNLTNLSQLNNDLGIPENLVYRYVTNPHPNVNNPVPFKDFDGTPLTDAPGNYMYDVSLMTNSTGTATGARQVIYYEGGTWKVLDVGDVKKNSNHPFIEIIGGVPMVRTVHSTTYSVSLNVRRYYRENRNAGSIPNFLGLTFDSIFYKPTTLAGYGITDGATTSWVTSNYVSKGGDFITGRIEINKSTFEGFPNSTNSVTNNYVNQSLLSVGTNNNSIHFFGDGTFNSRRMGIQSGHRMPNNSSALGILELNPFGGEVRVNGLKAATESWASSNFVSKSGDTLTGSLIFSNTHGIVINNGPSYSLGIRDMGDINSSWARTMHSVRLKESIIDTMGHFGTSSGLTYGYIGGGGYNVLSALRWTSDGNVGIGLTGTNSPQEVLDVEGSIRIKSSIGNGLSMREGTSIYSTVPSNSNVASAILRQNWTSNNSSFVIGGIGSSGSGRMSRWGVFRFLNDRIENADDGFFGFTDHSDRFQITNLSGTGTRMVVANTSGVLETMAIPTDTTYTAGNGLTLSGTTFALGTPGAITALSTNSSTANSHTHALETLAIGNLDTGLITPLTGFVQGATNGPLSPAGNVYGFWTTSSTSSTYGGGFFARNNQAWFRTRENNVIQPWQELWHIGNASDIITNVQVVGSSSYGVRHTVTRALGANYTVTHLGNYVIDARSTSSGLGSDGNATYLPTTDSISSSTSFAYFHTSSRGWESSLITKGWTGGYTTWRISGFASTSSNTRRDFYLSHTLANGTWGPDYMIYHDGNLSGFTRTSPGLVPMPGGSTSTRFLREDGTWVVPTNTTYSGMTYAEATSSNPSATNRLISSKTLNDWFDYRIQGYTSAIIVHQDTSLVSYSLNATVTSGQSIAIGTFASASGTASMATGPSANASGTYTSVYGPNSSVQGSYAGAFGAMNLVDAMYSYTFGYALTSYQDGHVILGMHNDNSDINNYNITGKYATNLNLTRLLTVGAGTSSSDKFDAFVMYRDGSAKLLGAWRYDAQNPRFSGPTDWSTVSGDTLVPKSYVDANGGGGGGTALEVISSNVTSLTITSAAHDNKVIQLSSTNASAAITFSGTYPNGFSVRLDIVGNQRYKINLPAGTTGDIDSSQMNYLYLEPGSDIFVYSNGTSLRVKGQIVW